MIWRLVEGRSLGMSILIILSRCATVYSGTRVVLTVGFSRTEMVSSSVLGTSVRSYLSLFTYPYMPYQNSAEVRPMAPRR